MSIRPFAWEKTYPPSVSWDDPLEITTLREMFDKAVSAFASRPVLEFRDRRMSFAELGQKVDAAASAFLALGHDREKPMVEV